MPGLHTAEVIELVAFAKKGAPPSSNETPQAKYDRLGREQEILAERLALSIVDRAVAEFHLKYPDGKNWPTNERVRAIQQLIPGEIFGSVALIELMLRTIKQKLAQACE